MRYQGRSRGMLSPPQGGAQVKCCSSAQGLANSTPSMTAAGRAGQERGRQLLLPAVSALGAVAAATAQAG